jgi:prevent-host-death family protein
MRTVKATELKAKLSAILGDVERGDTVLIERHGKAIAQIKPIDDQAARHRRRAAIERILEYKRTGAATGISAEDILSARDEGRKPI